MLLVCIFCFIGLIVIYGLLITSFRVVRKRRVSSLLELTLEGSTDDGAGSATIGYRTIEFRDIALGPSLGSGAFGQVRRGKWHNSNVAVKIMDYDKDSFEFIAREAKIMTLLGNHPNVIPFIGMAKEVDKIYLLTKMCHFGSLYDHFIKKKSTTTDVEF